MSEATFGIVGRRMGVQSRLSINGISSSTEGDFGLVTAGFSPADGPHAEEDVSIAGVMLLSAMSVLMAIAGMVTFALFVIACWWLISHVPVPAAVHQLLAKLHL